MVPDIHYRLFAQNLIVLPIAREAAYWGSSVLSEVNLEKSFEVQSDSCIKSLHGNNKEPTSSDVSETEQQSQPHLQFVLVTEQRQRGHVNSLRGVQALSSFCFFLLRIGQSEMEFQTQDTSIDSLYRKEVSKCQKFHGYILRCLMLQH